MKKTTKSATTKMWGEYWQYVNPTQDMFEIWADELHNGKWKYEIEPPLINLHLNQYFQFKLMIWKKPFAN